MARLLWRARALADLEQIHAWLSAIDGAEPDRALSRLHAAAESLVRLGDIGRHSRVPGLRELSVRTEPYVIVYRMAGEVIEVVAVYHTAQSR